MSCNRHHVTVPAPRIDVPPEDAVQRTREFYETMRRRRTIRDFSSAPVPFELIENAILAAGTAPSGANVQPWRFVVVSDPARKRALREAAEEEERTFYEHRASEEWLQALAPLGTGWRKEFLEEAPYVIAVMEVHKGSETPRPYYTKESVGIAVGFLLAGLHQAGLATLTHTPSPMRFINEALDRPREERAFVLIPVGYPSDAAEVPDIARKGAEQIMIHLDADGSSAGNA